MDSEPRTFTTIKHYRATYIKTGEQFWFNSIRFDSTNEMDLYSILCDVLSLSVILNVQSMY